MLLCPLRKIKSWASEANLKSRGLHIPNSDEQLYPPIRQLLSGWLIAHGGGGLGGVGLSTFPLILGKVQVPPPQGARGSALLGGWVGGWVGCRSLVDRQRRSWAEAH